MSYTFDWVSKDVVKKLQGKDLKPVKRLSDATKFRQFDILQKTPQSLFFKSEDIPVGYSLLKILEPNFPVPEPEVSAPIPLKHTVSQKLKANVDVKAIAEGGASAEFVQSCGYDIEVQSTSIPESKLESLQNRKLVDQEPSFVTNCRMGKSSLYVVTEAFEVIKGTVLEGSSSIGLSAKALIPQFVKGQAQGQWQRDRTDSVPILKGAVLAYKKKQLVIENNTCAILLSGNAKKKTFPGIFNMVPKCGFAFQPMSIGEPLCDLRINEMSSDDDLSIEIEPCPIIRLGLWINDIPPIGSIEEPVHLDFKCLQNEVSLQTEQLAMLSKDVQDVVFSSLLHMLSDREVLYDLMNMLELDQLGHMDGPGGIILDELRKDSSPPWIDLKELILYLLQALMVLSDTQLNLLAKSMEMRLLLQQRELVKSILQPNFKYPWNIPFTLQPQLLAPLHGEGLAITYELLKECGLKMELNNPRSTWDLEAKMPLSALYGSLSFLQQLAEA
ncbi:gasdermin-C [Grammomys surdaster]|uniref:gasdermin-C n=1 Tax=Grammomys surdaster TaxID=491861 RepID=UPI0010A08DD8|nr:gasdermin-C [Grammomys surdaster]